MSSPFLGEIKMVGFTFAPNGWANCDGSLLAISSYSALFSLLGTTYGGNGVSTFALPDLRGSVPIHVGHGPGLSNRTQGQKSGAETATLSIANLPAHSHTVNCKNALGDAGLPAGKLPAGETSGFTKDYSGQAADNTMNASMIANTGNGTGHNNMQPYLVIRFCIALVGLYPSRP